MIKNREQLDIVLQAIIAARNSTSDTTAFGKAIRLVRQPKTPLWTIKPMDLLRLLQKLEEEEKIIRLCLPDDQPPSALESAQQIRRDIPPFNHYSSQVAGKMITGFQSTGRGGLQTISITKNGKNTGISKN